MGIKCGITINRHSLIWIDVIPTQVSIFNEMMNVKNISCHCDYPSDVRVHLKMLKFNKNLVFWRWNWKKKIEFSHIRFESYFNFLTLNKNRNGTFWHSNQTHIYFFKAQNEFLFQITRFSGTKTEKKNLTCESIVEPKFNFLTLGAFTNLNSRSILDLDPESNILTLELNLESNILISKFNF